MEVIRGWTHTAFPIEDVSRIGEARRHAAHLVAELGWDAVASGRLAIVVTELGTNLFKHAKHGQLLIALRAQEQDVEIVAIDEGPGIASVGRSMQDGSTTGSSPGTGLGAIRRLTHTFDIHSVVDEGTLCVARVRRSDASQVMAKNAFEVGAICVPVRGEVACGDGWSVAHDSNEVTALVADGLGHGPAAALASAAAVEQFASTPTADLRALVEHIHGALQGTRGAAVCVLRIVSDGGATAVRCAGAGNVAVRVVSGVSDRSMVTQHGTAGLQIRKPDMSSIELPLHGVVVIHSDGIASRWDARRLMPVLEKDPTLAAAMLYRDHSRKRDDVGIVVLRERGPA